MPTINETADLFSILLAIIGKLMQFQATKVVNELKTEMSFEDLTRLLKEQDKDIDLQALQRFRKDWAQHEQLIPMLMSSISVQQYLNTQNLKNPYQDLDTWLDSPAWFYSRPTYYHRSYYGPGFYDPYPRNVIIINNYGSGHSGGSGDFNMDGEGAIIVLLIVFAPLIIYGIYKATENIFINVNQICTELANNQRVLTNIATLALISLATAGVIAFLASNPAGWGVAAAVLATVCLYMVLSATVSLIHHANQKLDASVSESLKVEGDRGSSLKGDSRFQLTTKEENMLRDQHEHLSKDKQDILLIQVKLAIDALGRDLSEGKVKPNAATKILGELKKGDLSHAPALSATSQYKMEITKGRNKEAGDEFVSSYPKFKTNN